MNEVREAINQLRQLFGNDEIVIEDFIDPEAENSTTEQFIVVRTYKTVDEANRLLNEFLDKKDSKINVTIEFPVGTNES